MRYLPPLVLTFLLFPSAVFAQEKISMEEPTATTEVDPMGYFEAAQRAFNLGDFDKALKEFTKAYEVTGDVVLLYNVGLCHSALGHINEAFHVSKRVAAESDIPSSLRIRNTARRIALSIALAADAFEKPLEELVVTKEVELPEKRRLGHLSGHLVVSGVPSVAFEGKTVEAFPVDNALTVEQTLRFKPRDDLLRPTVGVEAWIALRDTGVIPSLGFGVHGAIETIDVTVRSSSDEDEELFDGVDGELQNLILVTLRAGIGYRFRFSDVTIYPKIEIGGRYWTGKLEFTLGSVFENSELIAYLDFDVPASVTVGYDITDSIFIVGSGSFAIRPLGQAQVQIGGGFYL